MQQTELLPPFPKRHLSFTLEQSFDGPLVCARPFAKLFQAALIAWLVHERCSHSLRSWVNWFGQLQRNALCSLQLVQDHAHQMNVLRFPVTERGSLACMENQFAHEWRNVHHSAMRRHAVPQTWLQIQSSHGYEAGHPNFMWSSCWNPYRSPCRNNPRAPFRLHGHNALRGIHQLVPFMKMPRDLIAVRIVVSKRGDQRQTPRAMIPQCGLSLLSHSLSE